MKILDVSAFDKRGADDFILPRADALHDIIRWTGVELNGTAGCFFAIEDNVGELLGIDFCLFQLAHYVGNHPGLVEVTNHKLPWSIGLLTVV